MSIRVGILYDGLRIPATDGVTQRVVELVQRLRVNDDIEPILYLVDRGWATKEQLDSLGVVYHLTPLSYAYGDDVNKLVDLLQADKVDLVHSAGSHLAILLYAAYVARMAGVPLIGDMHDVYRHLMTSLEENVEEIAAAELRQKLCTHLADGIITMSSRDVPAIQEYGAPADRLFCIPNGVTMQTRPSADAAHRNAVFVGNMFYEPNRRAALRIIERIAPLVPEQRFYLVGGASDDLIRKAADAPNVTYMGAVDDLHEAFEHAAVGLAPLQEGSGMKLKVMTYGAYGLAVVASEEALAGYAPTDAIISAESDEAFADALCALTASHEINQKYRKAAYEYILGHYDWNVLIDAEVAAFKKIQSMPQRKIPHYTSDDTEPAIIHVEEVGLPLWMQEGRV